MRKVYYWSPCLANVGTVISTLNSAISLSKYSKKKFDVNLINVCGEWDKYKDFFLSNDIKIIDLNFKYFNLLPKTGFLASRFSYLIIFILSFVPLLNLLKKNKPDYIIIHLITSLPLILLNLFKFKTKFILRISGFPKLTFLRKFLWKISSEKVYLVTTPTIHLIDQLKKIKLFNDAKLSFLPDAILNMKTFLQKTRQNDKIDNKIIDKKYFITAGRLTKQKNFHFLIDEFDKFLKHDKSYNLLIFGEGELKKSLNTLIKNKQLKDKVFLMGYSKNLFYYIKRSKAFILSSLWEEPGFVLVEAAMCNAYIISSDCFNGPSEFLDQGNSGTLFKNNEKNALYKALKDFVEDKSSILEKKILSKKRCKKYSMFRHNKYLQKLLN